MSTKSSSILFDVDNLELKAEYMDEQDMDKDDLLLCNLAFVPRDSALVSKVIGKVPDNQLVKFGIKLQDSTGDTAEERRAWQLYVEAPVVADICASFHQSVF